jgi:hypothetical protein
MNAGKFWLLTFLSLVIAVLILLEITCENQVASLTAQVGMNEARISQARAQNELLRQLVQRIAIMSQRDLALADLLAKRGIHLNAAPRGAGPNSLPATPTPGITPLAPTTPPTPSTNPAK